MKLSLSVRVVESPCKTRLLVPFEELVRIARETGYDALCLRASAAGIGTPPSRLAALRRFVDDAGLRVSMVTADCDVPLNNDHGPDSLRDIGPSLDVAEALGCDLLRVCLKRCEDIAFARLAAERAGRRGLRLAHQCHTASLFEEVGPLVQVLAEIGQPNFGLIYEPANLLLCGQSYGPDTLAKVRPYLMNVYVQNHRLDAHGPCALTTFCLGEVRYQQLDPWDRQGIDMQLVASGLRGIGYQGFVTIHQAQGLTTARAVRDFAARCASLFRSV
jgi:sugar phosphate isomerase/epimerase